MLNATLALTSQCQKQQSQAPKDTKMDPSFALLDRILAEGDTTPVFQVLAISAKPAAEMEDQSEVVSGYKEAKFAYCIPMWSDKN